MENKQTAVDILFQEIKESKSFLPDNLFAYLEDVYNKAKSLDENELYSAEEASERLYPIKNTGSMFMPNLDEVNNIYKQEGFMEGAKWVINKIKQQDNG